MPTFINDVAVRRGACRPRAPGFTLVEVLVVVVIVGLLASLVAVNLAPDARQSLSQEGGRLAALLGHARDEAIVTGATLAWQRTEGGYRFLERAPDRTWRPIAGDPALRQRDLLPGMQLAAVGPAVPARSREPIIVLAPTGIADPFRITLVLGEHQVWVVSDGVGAPFLETPRL